MIEKLKKILAEEDKRNPLTDEKIAEMLNIRREKVNELRAMASIGDSRERRKEAIIKDAEKIILKDRNISDRKITNELNSLGYSISRYTAKLIKEDVLRKLEKIEEDFSEEEDSLNKFEEPQNILTSEEHDSNKELDEYECFKNIIGYNQGLKIKIDQAKAAILYPPNGLNTLILGQSGTGKSHLAENMYKFAVKSKILKDNSPFVVFNCADYANNPQLLLSQLFGHTKGAFSGADSSKIGLVEKANGGILFLDEIHRLPSEGQEILFLLLDKGKFRKLGETNTETKVNVRIIAATTENPESSLLLTFRRRIPMVIELPTLKDRTNNERYAIIKEFFLRESIKINKSIIVEAEVMRTLMLYECKGNIGQLVSDIQVACAKGFLNSISENKNELQIRIQELPGYVSLNLTNVNKRKNDTDQFINKKLIINPNKTKILEEDESKYIFFDKIYTFIENSFNELKQDGIDEEEVNRIVQNRLALEFEKYVWNVEENINKSLSELESIVDKKVIDITKRAIKIAKNRMPDLEEKIYYFLTIHLSSLIERLERGVHITSANAENIMFDHPNEYETAELMVKFIEKELKIKLPKEEICIIAMYIKTFSGKENNVEGRVKVIVLTHGKVATAIAEVANKLLGVDSVVGIEMDFTENPKSALNRTMEVVENIDEGKGCLLLVDMGSLITFGEIITQKTGIKTRSIGRVDTVMVIEAARRAFLSNETLESIELALDEDKKNYVGKFRDININNNKPKVIITMCITGKGTAAKIKKYIEDSISSISKNVNIVSLGLLDKTKMEEELSNLLKEYNVIAIVGTINLNLNNIPFISVEEILSGNGLLSLDIMAQTTGEEESSLKDVVSKELIIYNLEAESKNQVIDSLFDTLLKNENVTEEFLLSIYKRENLGCTYLDGGIGIPHGETKFVIKPAIAVAKLINPVEWDEGKVVDFVCLFALTNNCKKYVDIFYDIISNENALEALRNADSVESIENIFNKKQF